VRRLYRRVLQYWSKSNRRDDEFESGDIITIDPFAWRREKDLTSLESGQIFYFYLILILNLTVYFAGVGIFFTLFHRRFNHSDDWNLISDIGGLAAQTYSWLCAIVSCFIFSKVAYAVRNMSANQLFACLDRVAKEVQPTAEVVTSHVKDTMRCLQDTGNNNFMNILRLDGSRLHLLQSIDRLYSEVLKDWIRPYSRWFAFHWLMYTLTAFVSVAYVIESTLVDLYRDNVCTGEHTLDCRLTITYKILFSLSHCMLFLYPCFRAASVTATRFRFIKKVSRARWPYVSLQEKQAFIQYLKDQNRTFKVSILCAHISFGFNITFYSVFIGMMGVVLKLSL
jgi:hypothetical protein